jgi:hypothetical protein
MTLLTIITVWTTNRPWPILNPVLDRFGQDPKVGPGLKWAKAFDTYVEEFIVYAADHTLDSTCYAFGGWSLPASCEPNRSKEDQRRIHIDDAIKDNFCIKLQWLLKGELLGASKGLGCMVPLLSAGFMMDMATKFSTCEGALLSEQKAG